MYANVWDNTKGWNRNLDRMSLFCSFWFSFIEQKTCKDLSLSQGNNYLQPANWSHQEREQIKWTKQPLDNLTEFTVCIAVNESWIRASAVGAEFPKTTSPKLSNRQCSREQTALYDLQQINLKTLIQYNSLGQLLFISIFKFDSSHQSFRLP